MALCRLIYVSTAVEPFDPKTAKQIGEVSAPNNKRLGVTGILLATETRYLQVLEGPVQAVNMLFKSIQADERHSEVSLISYHRIEQHLFEAWSMKGTCIGLLGRILANTLKKKYGEEEGDLFIPMDEYMAFALLYDVYISLKSE